MRWRTEQPAGQTDRHIVHFLRLARSFARQQGERENNCYILRSVQDDPC